VSGFGTISRVGAVGARLRVGECKKSAAWLPDPQGLGLAGVRLALESNCIVRKVPSAWNHRRSLLSFQTTPLGTIFALLINLVEHGAMCDLFPLSKTGGLSNGHPIVSERSSSRHTRRGRLLREKNGGSMPPPFYGMHGKRKPAMNMAL